ncbi:MAG: hypothetical protein ACHQ9S_23290 [Candidatus Binatia bacterium]
MITVRPLSLPAPSTVGLRAGDADEAITRRVTGASRSSRASGTAVTLFTVLVLFVVMCGWLLRDRVPLTPKSGPGYALGVGGAATMLLLSSYSAAKRLRFLRRWSPLSHWFRIHMILGVLGPVQILFHCNFRFGALNSDVALVSMLVVAASGVVGRYIYTRITHGLYGARATFEELHAQLDVSAHNLGERLPPASRAAQRLAAFATRVRAPRRSIGGRLFRLVALPLVAIWVRGRALHDLGADLESAAARDGWDARTRRANEKATRKMISAYIVALVKEVQFSVYERLFSLWHALHIPLFIMLVLTGVMHVVAVHKY